MKFVFDAALKAFAQYAREKWNVSVKTNAIPAGTPVAYGRIVEWKGKPEADIFWGGESALFEKLQDQKLIAKLELSQDAWDSIPASIGQPTPIPLKDKDGYWVGTALEPYGLVYHPRLLKRLGVPDLKDWEDLLHPKLPITPKYRMQGAPGSKVELAVEFTGGVRSYFDAPVANVYDEDVAKQRSAQLKEKYRKDIEAVWKPAKGGVRVGE